MAKYSYLLIGSTIILLVFGVVFFGLLNPNTFVLKVSSEGTPPADFDVVLGQSKLKALRADTLKHFIFEDCCVNVIDKKEFQNIWDGYYDHYYIVNAELNGLSNIDANSKFLYPLLKVTKWTKVLNLFIWAYIVVSSILIVGTIAHLIKIARHNS